MRIPKRSISIILTLVLTIISICANIPLHVKANPENVTIYFVDSTEEEWLANDSAVMELVDNTSGHDSYTMTTNDNKIWSVEVPASAYNITFNRYDQEKSLLWNSWSAGGRDGNVTYRAESALHGRWTEEEPDIEGFQAGDIVYLDLTEFTDWLNNAAVLYVNFTDATKNENGGNDITIANADRSCYNPVTGLKETEDNVYSYEITEEDTKAAVLRFWRGNDDTLWNCSPKLTYEEYKKGNNCVKVTGWSESGSLAAFEKNEEDELEKLLKELAKDSDHDGAPDFYETEFLNTDPYNPDSDGNGVCDGDEDFDKDGLANAYEIENSLNPMSADTDIDGLSDYDELQTYHTDASMQDTDGDGATDGWEVENGYDPCTYNDSFTASLIDDEDMEGNLEAVTVEISGADGMGADTLDMERVENALLNEEVPGYIGSCYEFTSGGTFESAKISFAVKEELMGTEGFEPAIYYFDEETQLLEEVEGQKTEGNVVSAELSHFSKYILLNKTEYKKVWNYQLLYIEDGQTTYEGMDIVFVIDSSGSMSTNDRGGVRKRVTNEFIQKLTEKDRAAVIQFATSAALLSPFTADKKTLQAAVNRIGNSGGTSLSSGISMAINQFPTSQDAEQEGMKCIIMLTDGDGSYNSSLTQTAAARGIVIYTVGLGSSVSSSLLTSIAIGTGGSYYHANNVSQLYGIFDSIADQSDLGKDTDGDGLNDYYEKEICSGHLRLGTGVRLTGLNYQNPDTDNDGLKDGAEIKVTKNGNRITVRMISNPTKADTDGDGYPDSTDEYPLYPNSYKYLGDEKYFQHLNKELISVKNESWKYGFSATSFIAGHAVKIMIRDYYRYKDPDSIPDSYWDKYCNQFNSYVRSYGDVYQELHYFRNNLNRAPSSLDEMISTINSASGSTWRLLSVWASLYHMYGENGEYNLKFVSSDGKYEGVYNKNGTELTEVNDPVNMGTYNYADPSDGLEHTYFDVITYSRWGNTRDSVEDCKKASAATELAITIFKFNQNNAAKSYRSQIENRIQ